MNKENDFWLIDSNSVGVTRFYKDNNNGNKIIDYIQDLSVKKKIKTLTITAMKKDKSSRELYINSGFAEKEKSGNRISLEKDIR